LRHSLSAKGKAVVTHGKVIHGKTSLHHQDSAILSTMMSMRSRKDVRSPKTLPGSAVSSQSNEGYSDEQRAKERYKEAVQLLAESIKKRQGQWGSFEFPELTGEPKDFDDALFIDKINATLKVRKTTIKDQTAWTKCHEAIQCFFKRFSPFAKNFLLVAKEGQAVSLFLSHLI
jgi:hypothetical protein